MAGLRGKTAEDCRLLEIVDPVAEAEGYDVVRLRLMAGDRARRLQIMAERTDGTMPVGDCAALARAVARVLDASQAIDGGYMLEVSSPGIDRPLTRPGDFSAWSGWEARVEIDRIFEGHRRFKGTLADAPAGLVAIRPEGAVEAVQLPFAWIVEAKLVLTDALLARGAKARAERLTPPRPPHFDQFDQKEKTA